MVHPVRAVAQGRRMVWARCGRIFAVEVPFVPRVGARAHRLVCVLGLPDHVTACLFDLDGVLTQTAKVHDAAWPKLFNVLRLLWAGRAGEPYAPFDPVDDYNSYVDGRPRADGVRTFLASRGI